MNPNTALPGEEIYVRIPKLAQHVCLVSGSLKLLFDFKTANTKSHFLNNIRKHLKSKLQVLLTGATAMTTIGRAIGAHTKTSGSQILCRRNEIVQYGVANENLRKLISKDYSGTSSGDTTTRQSTWYPYLRSSKTTVCTSHTAWTLASTTRHIIHDRINQQDEELHIGEHAAWVW